MATIEQEVDVDELATITFSEWTADKLSSNLGLALKQVIKCAVASIKINTLGGIGNGIDKTFKSTYLENIAYYKSIKGYGQYRDLLSFGNVAAVQVFRFNNCILNAIVEGLERIKKDEAKLAAMNEKVKKLSKGKYDSIDSLFANGMMIYTHNIYIIC